MGAPMSQQLIKSIHDQQHKIEHSVQENKQLWHDVFDFARSYVKELKCLE